MATAFCSVYGWGLIGYCNKHTHNQKIKPPLISDLRAIQYLTVIEKISVFNFRPNVEAWSQQRLPPHGILIRIL